jgi:hypothetical protein
MPSATVALSSRARGSLIGTGSRTPDAVEAPLGNGAPIGGRRQGRECRLDQQLLCLAVRRVPGSAADSKTKVTQIRSCLLTTPTPTWRKGE